VKITND
jgi:Ca2+-binding EF-hand superfamily protein